MASHLLHNLLVFGRLLRRAGLDVHRARLLDTAAALQHVDIGSRDEVHAACRALLVHRHDDLPTFDRAFALFWRARPHADDAARDVLAAKRRQPPGPPQPPGPSSATGALQPAAIEAADPEAEAVEVGTWSAEPGLAKKDFGTFTAEEVRAAHAALERLAWTPGLRRTRRWVPGKGAGLDLRRALALGRRTGGDIVTLPRRRRRDRPRPLVLLCDVSGSMERYSRLLLHFAHAMSGRARHLEAFLFSTSLTRVTRQLHHRSVDAAVSAVTDTVGGWSGGTRIGESVRQFHREWGRRVLHRGPVVLLVSDGWDRGDPALLRGQVARLQRRCTRLIWLNPLIGTAGYAPLTRGLQAALPYVDDFLPVRTLNDLADLATHLNTLSSTGARRP